MGFRSVDVSSEATFGRPQLHLFVRQVEVEHDCLPGIVFGRSLLVPCHGP